MEPGEEVGGWLAVAEAVVEFFADVVRKTGNLASKSSHRIFDFEFRIFEF